MATSFFLDLRSPDCQEQLDAMFRALNDSDPLVCTLICTAHIDKCLVSLLEHFLVKASTTKDKHLYNDKAGILTTLYTRAEFAYMLGLINSNTLELIRGIATIRNHFAHSHEPLSFKSEQIVAACNKLNTPAPQIEVMDGVMAESEQTREYWKSLDAIPRNRFVKAVSHVVMVLAMLPAKIVRPNTPFINGES
jgi:DNA-binding MltR family transcriptional regulator